MLPLLIASEPDSDRSVTKTWRLCDLNEGSDGLDQEKKKKKNYRGHAGGGL